MSIFQIKTPQTATGAGMKGLKQLTLVAAISSVSSMAFAEALTSINATQLSPLETEVRLMFNGPAVAPKAYKLSNPERLILDLEDVDYELANRVQKVSTSQVDSISGLDNENMTRLVFTMPTANSYKTSLQGNELVLRLTTDTAANAPTQAYVSPISSPAPAPVPSDYIVIGGSEAQVSAPNYTTSQVMEAPITQRVESAPQDIQVVTTAHRINPLLDEQRAGNIRKQYEYFGLDAVNFAKAAQGGGQVVIDLANASVPVDVQRKGSQIIVRMLGAKVPKPLARRMKVSDYGTPVQNIDSFNDGNNGVVVIQPMGEFDYQVYQADDLLTIDVNPIVKVRDPRPQQKTYSGEPLSLDFQDVEIRAVLQLIADFTGINLVASDSVSGRMTLRLQNVPWDQALDIILKSRGLDMRSNGNVIMIAPADELAEQERKAVEAQQQFKELAPLRTEYMQLSYAKASDLKTLIGVRSSATTGGNVAGGSGSGTNTNNSLLSERGTVSIDERTNTLIIQDTADKIDEIRGLVEKIDVPVRQVMIEARIVRATDNFTKELGVKWGVLSQGRATNNSLLVGGSDQTLWDLREFEIDDTTGLSYEIERPQNLSVDLGVTSAGASSIAFGLLEMSDLMLDLELSALQADGKGEIVSSPKVLTTDKQAATVAAGTQIPYTTVSQEGTVTEFKNAELSLSVTPSITPDGRVQMDLKVNNDTPNILATGDVAIDTNRVETNVLVDDGQTVVLGGIFQNSTNSSVTKTPLLGDLPVLGQLFRKTVNENDKQELLIFVTPRLVNENVSNVYR